MVISRNLSIALLNGMQLGREARSKKEKGRQEDRQLGKLKEKRINEGKKGRKKEERERERQRENKQTKLIQEHTGSEKEMLVLDLQMESSVVF